MGRELIDWNAEPVRWKIAHEFARWATREAVNSQGKNKQYHFPKSQVEVNGYLATVEFDTLFNKELGPIDDDEFAEWHRQQIDKLQECHENISVGWAAKMIAIYLKTTCYLSRFGREGLDEVIHPPLDANLRGVVSEVLKRTQSKSFYSQVRPYLGKNYNDVDAEVYEILIGSCEFAATRLGLTPFELEKFWKA